MKKTLVIMTMCCAVSLLFLSACSRADQNLPQSTKSIEATKETSQNDVIVMQQNILVQYPLADSEEKNIEQQSQFLQDAGIEDMTKETADELAEYFVRCQRLELTDSPASIQNARHEIRQQTDAEREAQIPNWEYWILTLSDGTEYWLMGFTNESFKVSFVFRDAPDGEILFGYKR